MAKRKGSIYGATVIYERTFGGTSIGRRPKFSSMNKKRNWKKYRGQGKGR